jgi:outer membrane protein insertion porin family
MRSGSGSAPARTFIPLLAALALLLLPGRVAAARGPVVDKIHFAGNDHTHPDSLLARMGTAESGFLKRHRLDAFTLGQDLVNIEVYYQELGFLTAEARTANLDYNDDSSHVSIHVKIKEGPQWIVQNLTFTGNSQVATEDLAKAVGFKVGDPYSPTKVLIGRDNLIDHYDYRSYLHARVESKSVRDDPSYRASVSYTVFEGGIATIGDVQITGLVKTDTSVVRRELTLKKGERIRVRDVARSQSNLYTTGLFRSVYISPDTSSAGDSVKTVTVALVERKTGQLSFGVGYGTEDRFRVTTELRHRNLLGQNLEAGLEGTLSRRRGEVSVAFSQPWSFGLRFKINEKAGFRHLNDVAFASDGIYFGGSILRPIYPFWRLEGGYDWSRDVILRGPDPGTGEAIPEGETRTTRVSRIFTQATYETRDDLLNTYHGYYLNVAMESAGAFLGGTASFLRGTADQRFFRKLGDVVVGLHLSAGAMRQQEADVPIPVTERFFAGGQGTIRGFPEDRIGPKDDDGNPIGGVERIYLQTEGRMPLFWIVGGVLFADVGLLADRPPGFLFSETAAGAGLGLRIRSPIGIIRLDLAAPLTKSDSDGLQFTFGTSQEF